MQLNEGNPNRQNGVGSRSRGHLSSIHAAIDAKRNGTVGWVSLGGVPKGTDWRGVQPSKKSRLLGTRL